MYMAVGSELDPSLRGGCPVFTDGAVRTLEPPDPTASFTEAGTCSTSLTTRADAGVSTGAFSPFAPLDDELSPISLTPTMTGTPRPPGPALPRRW